jgi:hypothetical protein
MIQLDPALKSDIPTHNMILIKNLSKKLRHADFLNAFSLVLKSAPFTEIANCQCDHQQRPETYSGS